MDQTKLNKLETHVVDLFLKTDDPKELRSLISTLHQIDHLRGDKYKLVDLKYKVLDLDDDD